MHNKSPTEGERICYRYQEGITYVFRANRPAPEMLPVPMRRSFECVAPYPESPRFKGCPDDVLALVLKLRTIPGLQRVRLGRRELKLVALSGTVPYEVPGILQSAQQEVENFLRGRGWQIIGRSPTSAKRRRVA